MYIRNTGGIRYIIMKREIFEWSWESEAGQDSFSRCVGFKDEKASRAEVLQIESLLRLTPCRMIDIGCGNGRQTLIFAEKGYTVTGIDIASRFLETAKQNANKMHLAVDFQQKRASELTQKDVFDFALAYNHNIGFLSDKERLLHFRKIYACLHDGGIFFMKTAGPQITENAQNYTLRDWNETEKEFILVDKKIENGYRYEKCITIDKDSGDIKEYREKQRAFSLQEIINILQGAGFQKITCYADFERTPADVNHFGIFICQKS